MPFHRSSSPLAADFPPCSTNFGHWFCPFLAPLVLRRVSWGLKHGEHRPWILPPIYCCFEKWEQILSINPVTYARASDFCFSLFGYIFPVGIFHSSSDLLSKGSVRLRLYLHTFLSISEGDDSFFWPCLVSVVHLPVPSRTLFLSTICNFIVQKWNSCRMASSFSPSYGSLAVGLSFSIC
jgi:hypothetical protein